MSSIVPDVDALFDLLARPDATDDGEGVSMLAHHLQTVARLAIDAPDDRELQIAGLVHDLGTTLEPGRPLTHARTGADTVRALLGERVAALVAQHDQAKRYLVTVDADYLRVLSPQSIATLEVQGGPMDPTEVREFERRPDFEACVALRRADDDAKVPGKDVPPLTHWRATLFS